MCRRTRPASAPEEARTTKIKAKKKSWEAREIIEVNHWDGEVKICEEILANAFSWILCGIWVQTRVQKERHFPDFVVKWKLSILTLSHHTHALYTHF